MELIAPYARMKCGLDFLFDSNTIEWLIDLSCGEHEQSHLLGSQAIRELGHILRLSNENNIEVPWGTWRYQQEAFFRFLLSDLYDYLSLSSNLGKLDNSTTQVFLKGITSYLNSPESSQRVAGMVALATYGGSSVAALRQILKDSDLLDSWLTNFSSINEIRAAALNSVALILDSNALGSIPSTTVFESAGASPADASDLKRGLVERISVCFKGLSTVAYLLKIARTPTDDLKHAALNLLRSIISNTGRWGTQLVMSDTEFLRYLEDTTTEYSRVGHEMKFSCVDALWQSDSKQLLNEDIVRRIEALIKRGPFFTSARMAEPLVM